jgi:hypothetical protein
MPNSSKYTYFDNLQCDGADGDGKGFLRAYINETKQTSAGTTILGTAASVSAYGMSLIPATTAQAGNKFYLVDTPSATYSNNKFISIGGQSTDAASYIYASATGAITFDGTNYIVRATSTNSTRGYVELMPISATEWQVVGYTTNLAIGTTV